MEATWKVIQHDGVTQTHVLLTDGVSTIKVHAHTMPRLHAALHTACYGASYPSPAPISNTKY